MNVCVWQRGVGPCGHAAVDEAWHGAPGQRVGPGRRPTTCQVPHPADDAATAGVRELGRCRRGHQVRAGLGGATFPSRTCL